VEYVKTLYKIINMETKYKVAVVEFGGGAQVCTFKKKELLNDLQIYIAEAFYKGATIIYLYPDYRKKAHLAICRDEYSKEFTEECYLKLQNERKLKNLNQKIINLKSEIEYREKLIGKITNEILTLTKNN